MINRIVKLPESRSFFLFGPRQTGKSSLIQTLLKKKKIWDVNLLKSDLYLKYLKAPHLFRQEAEYRINKEKVSTIFIDEVQKIPLLLDEVQFLMGKYPRCRFILTGSSARKLKRGGANLLAGRALQCYLYPFTFQELKESFDLENVLRFGSLPPVWAESTEIKKQILNSYTDTYLREEIQAEGIVRNLGGFSRFLEIAAAQNGELSNFNAIGRDAGLPVKTVQNYYDILEDTLLALRVEGWRKSVRKRLTLHPKYYFFDTGVSNSLCTRLDSVPDAMLRGRLFEQWVILETHRCLSYLNSGIKIFFWRTNGGTEVDMLLVKGDKILAACEIKSTQGVGRADLSGLKSFGEEHPKVPLFVISTATNPYTMDGVDILPWKIYLEKLFKGKMVF